MPGTLFVVATPIGNLEDVSARALRVLREVSVIAAEDTRRTARLLSRFAIETPTTSLHEHNEHRKTAPLIERLRSGESVALVSDAGTPTVSDPGRRLIVGAVEAGCRVEPVPGPSALLAALAVSGFTANRFAFLGFPPVRSKDRKQWFSQLAASSGTVVFFEAPHRLRRTLEEVRADVGDVNVLVAREITKAHEELVRGPISQALDRIGVPRGEFTIVLEIGHMQDVPTSEGPGPGLLIKEFGLLTEQGGLSRRQVISCLAKRYGMSTNDVYSLIEQGRKKSEKSGGA
jgi:16S rRNA (cytidine1402-2'-O)-methyltransferase